jgi:hypothetical protein
VSPAERIDALKRSLSQASWSWQELRAAGVVDQAPAYLNQWSQAIDGAIEGGLLNPSELARTVGLA